MRWELRACFWCFGGGNAKCGRSWYLNTGVSLFGRLVLFFLVSASHFSFLFFPSLGLLLLSKAQCSLGSVAQDFSRWRGGRGGGSRRLVGRRVSEASHPFDAFCEILSSMHLAPFSNSQSTSRLPHHLFFFFPSLRPQPRLVSTRQSKPLLPSRRVSSWLPRRSGQDRYAERQRRSARLQIGNRTPCGPRIRGAIGRARRWRAVHSRRWSPGKSTFMTSDGPDPQPRPRNLDPRSQ